MLLVDGPISSEKVTDENMKKTHKEDYVNLDLSLGILGSSKVTCTGINKHQTEDAKRVEEKRTGVLMMELPLNPWTISKTLRESDINNSSRLMLDKTDVESHIMRHLSADVQKTIQQGNKFKVKVYDHDTDTEHDMFFKRHLTSRSYVFNGGWASEFVRRRDLKQGDTIGLLWSSVDSRLHFCVLQRKLKLTRELVFELLKQ